mgnify:CR=1 FL=1
MDKIYRQFIRYPQRIGKTSYRFHKRPRRIYEKQRRNIKQPQRSTMATKGEIIRPWEN